MVGVLPSSITWTILTRRLLLIQQILNCFRPYVTCSWQGEYITTCANIYPPHALFSQLVKLFGKYRLETTTTTLRWAFLLLALHPKVQVRMHEELQAYWSPRKRKQSDENFNVGGPVDYPDSPRWDIEGKRIPSLYGHDGLKRKIFYKSKKDVLV